MLERDASSANDPIEVLDETYFTFKTSTNVDKYYALFNFLKTYAYDLEEKFIAYKTYASAENLDSIKNTCDFTSLTSYGMVDIFATESDHAAKSFKLYKRIGDSKIKFGPCWDYDSCSYCLPYQGKLVAKPFEAAYTGSIRYLSCGETFNNTLIKKNNLDDNKGYWTSFINNNYETFMQTYNDEIERISSYLVSDTALWYDGDYSMVFDNLRYMSYYLTEKISYLNTKLLIN